MIKNIVLLFNILILMFFQNIFNENVAVTHNIPDNTAAGSEFIVDVNLKKDQVSGFAKLQFDLPEGFTAEVVEGKGASFTFKDQKAKFIWMSLPSEATFNVTFKVKVDATASGEKSIAGEFSYLENNEKKTFPIAEKKIMIGDGTGTSAPIVENNAPENKTVETPPASTGTETPAITSTEAPATNTAPPETTVAAVPTATEVTPPSTETASAGTGVSEVEITRQIDYSNINNKEIIVTVNVKKGAITGFSKLQETLPAGMSATKLETQSSTFAFEDQKVKFLWMNLPDQSEFKISYSIKIDENLSGEYFLNGEFSYLENGETKKKMIEQQAINISGTSGPTVAAKAPEKTTEETQKTEPAKTEPVKTKTAKTQKTAPATVTSTPAPVSGINFKVQVAASHVVVENDYFVKKHNISAPIAMEMHEGWNKYTTGSFPKYNEARDHRETIRETNSVVGPFVTAYNDGNRITVQEALMLAQQKWVK